MSLPLQRIFEISFFLIIYTSFLYHHKANADDSSLENIETSKNKECTLYLAESGIPNAGFGIYTTKDIEMDEVVSYDVAIPITDIMHHLGPNSEYIHWSHDDYNWRGDWENEYTLAEKVSINAFPIGALTNFHTYLHSVSPSDHSYDDSYLLRDRDPGVGAFSYLQRIFKATRSIKAGEEIYSNYGENWLDSHQFYDVPKKKNFRRAHRIIEELANNDITDLHTIQTLGKIISWYDKRTSTLLPNSAEESLDVNLDDLAWKTVQQRDLDWIKTNGKCLDKIYSERSTVYQAGKGAFASRFISKGELIIPVPLLQINNKTNFTMYEWENDPGTGKEVLVNSDLPPKKHLLLNYCFSHADSELLLCPSTHAAYINHNSQNPNAMYQWSEWDDTTQVWLNMTYEQIEKRKDKGLIFDIIATRDIQPGEEIFIDYGKTWENAWNEHVKHFKPYLEESFASTHHMNEVNYEIRTIAELRKNPYPSNVMTGCKYFEESYNDKKIPYMQDHDQEEQDVLVAIEHHRKTNSNPEFSLHDLVQLHSISFALIQNQNLEYWPCKVYARNQKDPNLFTVRIYQSPANYNTMWAENKSFRFVSDFPRDLIMFLNRPYKSDQLLNGVFRHPIGIRDEIFPEAWKNLR